MSFTKKINVNDGSGRKFEDVTTSEMVYDATPQLGSFNPVTSDGVAKAISGASGEVPAVNPGDAGKVLTAGFDGDTPTVSWEDSQGADYTAGDGIAINNSGVVSVNYDNTLTAKDETVTVTLPIGGDSDYTLERDGSADWYGYGNVFNISERSSLDGLQLTLAPGHWSSVSVNSGEQVIFVFVNPGDSTKYAYTSTGYGWASYGEIPLPLSATMYDVVYGGSATGISDVRDSEGNTLVYVSIATIEEGHGGDPNRVTPRVSQSKEHYYYGPYYDDGTTSGYLYTLYFATSWTESPNDAPNWDNIMTRYLGITYTSSTGNRKLSVTAPVATISGATDGKFLQSNGIATQWASVREVPTATNSEIGKVLGVTSGSPSTPNIGWVDQQGGTEYVAGNGIDIADGEISVKHDSTLTNVGGRQTVELTPSVEFSYHTYSSRPSGWYWGAYSMTVLAEDANSVNFTVSADSYLTWPWGDVDPAGKQVVGIVAKPTDPTAYYVAALKDSNYEDVYVNEFRTVGSGTYEIPNSSRAEIYKQNLSGIGAAIVDGKVTVALGLYDQTQHTLITSSDSYGPLYNGVPLYVYNLANTVVAGPEGDTPVEPGPDAVWSWNTGSHDPITKTIGEGMASLSVANPVPSVDGHTGEFLKAGSNGPEWGSVPDEVPSYSSSDDGKVLGVVDNAGSASLRWVSAGGGDTTVITYDSSSSARAATIFATIGAAVTAGKPVILVDTINKTVATLSGYRNDSWGQYASFGSFTYDAGGSVKGRNYLCSPNNFSTSVLSGAVANPSVTWSLNNGHLEASTAGNIKELCMVNIRANVGKDTLSGGEPADKSILYATVSIGADYSYAPVYATAVGLVHNDGTSWNAVFSLAFNNTSYTAPTNKMYLSVQDASGNAVDISGSRNINVTVAS